MSTRIHRRTVLRGLLGGAAAIEAAISVRALCEGIVPPTINLENVDPVCEALGLNYTPNVAVKKPVRAALANSFGFGGTNATLVLQRRSE